MRFRSFLLLLSLFSSTQIFAQSQHGNEIGAETDNDSYLLQGSDRYYTDGFFMYFRHAMATKDNSKLENKVLGFEFGQKIYNPQSGSIANYQGIDDPKEIDRPFAAYLYVGSTLNYLYSNESNLKISAQLGIVGPGAKGKEIQDFVHDNFGFYHPSGWEYQVDNNVQLNLSAEYNRLLARTYALDVSFTSYLNIGNGFSGAGLGPLFRLGNFNQLFNSVSTQSTAIKNNKTALLHKHEIFFYYKPQINFIAYDATIQGGLFTQHNPGSQEVLLDKEPLIFSNQVGVAFSTTRFVFDIAAIFHTKDVKEMVQSHQWAAITGLYRFK